MPGAWLTPHRRALWQPVPVPGPFACLAWSHLETQLLYVAEKSRPTLPAACPGHVPEAARPAEDEDKEVGGECEYTLHMVSVPCAL